ncbi:MAG: glycosyltransferase family 4 protein [Candidatus Eisenbacteria bacterium]|nr:glycosyltransferase family 4 protein [Candidatus Eisenbacteria bacterium]
MILNQGAVNGAVRQMAHWLPEAVGPRFETTVVFLRGPGPLGPRITPSGARVHEGALRWRFDLAGVAHLLVRARSWRPDVVFSIDERNATILSRMVGRFCGARVVQAIHSTPVRARFPLWDRLSRGGVSRFVALSPAHRDRLKEMGIPVRRIVIVPNGVADQDAVQMHKSPDAQMHVAFSGVLRQDKRVDLLLEAVARITAKAPRLRVVIAGDGPERSSLQALARSLGVDDRVSWLGWVEDVSSMLRKTDVFVLPSDPGVETLSMAALEAMAVGLPVVATRVGSMEDVVTRDTGILIDAGDIAGLSDALLLLYGNPLMRKTLGLAGRERQRSHYSATLLPLRMLSLLEDSAVRGTPAACALPLSDRE